MISKSHVLGCFACRICEGAGYQLPPMLYAGNLKGDILVIAQAPNEVSEKSWQLKAATTISSLKDDVAIKTVYELGIATTRDYSVLDDVLGKGWLESGFFLYTDAVRCRTKDDKQPSDEMISNCAPWTGLFAFPKVVVLIGEVAMAQVSRLLGKKELSMWSKVRLKRHPRVSIIISIPHYSALRSSEEIEQASELFRRAVDEAGVNYEN